MVKIIKPGFVIEAFDGEAMIRNIERAGRTCYKSESQITPGTARDFIRMIIGRGHESVLEHEKVTVRVICDRGVTHEIVRHRIASYSQESTRYCNYAKDKFGGEITAIDLRPFLQMHLKAGTHDNDTDMIWEQAMENAEKSYLALINKGVSPQIARGVLPNSLKTEIVITYNLREWRHFFRLRTSKAAHPQMRELTLPLLQNFKEMIPVVFDDIVGEI